MPAQTLRLANDTRLEPVFGDFDVDCRLLFLGDRHRLLLRAYQEAVFRFFHAGKHGRIADSLASSAEIQQFYEVIRANGDAAIRMRDSIFREQAPLDDLDVELRISRAGRNVASRPLPLDRLRALGCLAPLLGGERSEEEIRRALGDSLETSEAAWADELLEFLKSAGYVTGNAPAPNYFARRGPRPRVTFLSHSSVLLESRRTAVVADPLLRPSLGLPPGALDVSRIQLGAICCSHSHWDHCDVQTLLRFDKSTPILVPKVRCPSAFNPPIVGPLRSLGFTDIREVTLWEPLQIEDIEVVPVPFHGEQDEPDAEIDHYTYVLRTEGMTVYGGVDAYRDTFGEMKPVIERIADSYHPEVAFLPVSRMVYFYKWGGVNGYCRYLDTKLLDKSFQYTAGPEDAAEWAARLDSRYFVPYATFTFSRLATPQNAVAFGKALRRSGLGERFFPLRPLESLDAGDLQKSKAPALRRKRAEAWFSVGARASRMDSRLWRNPVYRLARRALARLSPPPAEHHH